MTCVSEHRNDACAVRILRKFHSSLLILVSYVILSILEFGSRSRPGILAFRVWHGPSGFYSTHIHLGGAGFFFFNVVRALLSQRFHLSFLFFPFLFFCERMAEGITQGGNKKSIGRITVPHLYAFGS